MYCKSSRLNSFVTKETSVRDPALGRPEGHGSFARTVLPSTELRRNGWRRPAMSPERWCPIETGLFVQSEEDGPEAAGGLSGYHQSHCAARISPWYSLRYHTYVYLCHMIPDPHLARFIVNYYLNHGGSLKEPIKYEKRVDPDFLKLSLTQWGGVFFYIFTNNELILTNKWEMVMGLIFIGLCNVVQIPITIRI